MAGKNDYGYFGSGAEGYAHYKQTFDSTMKNSKSNNGHITSKPKRQNDASDEVDILLKIVVPAVIAMFIFLK